MSGTGCLPALPRRQICRFTIFGAELAARNIHVGYGTLWRFFAKEKITFKKNRPRRRAGSA